MSNEKKAVQSAADGHCVARDCDGLSSPCDFFHSAVARSFNDWVGQMGLAGIFIFIAVYAAATVLLAPGAILTIGAGFAFGLWKGFLPFPPGRHSARRWHFSSPASSPATRSKPWQEGAISFSGSTMRSANKAEAHISAPAQSRDSI
jgi:hypothetical protein